MASVVHHESKVVLPLAGIIFLASLGIVTIQHLTHADFGAISTLSWIVVILGVAYFAIRVLAAIIDALQGY